MNFEAIQKLYPIVEEDPTWEFIDKAGHVHKYIKRGETAWVINSEVLEERFEEYWSDFWDDVLQESLGYFCKLCGEAIRPSYKMSKKQYYEIPGRAEYYIDNQMVTKEEFQKRLGEAT